MVQIIGPGTQRPTFGQKLAGGLGPALETGQRFMQEHQQKQQALEQQKKTAAALKQITGMDIGDLSPELQKAYLTEHLKGQSEERGFGQEIEKLREKSRLEAEARKAELSGKEEQKQVPFQAGMQTLNRMRELRKKGNLGMGSSLTGIFSPETRQDRGEYEQLGKSLISLASNIPIRNQQEFATLAEKLYDSSITDAEAEGILNAMERIISNSMAGSSIGGRAGAVPETQEKPKNRPPLSSFHR